mmetsp:Transcript_13006/g.29683  ORF Transcript_13006/g.29683 Transcript_13006/m.29683 type:complete len:214 (+) Transcript_13006:292-933(+)
MEAARGSWGRPGPCGACLKLPRFVCPLLRSCAMLSSVASSSKMEVARGTTKSVDGFDCESTPCACSDCSLAHCLCTLSITSSILSIRSLLEDARGMPRRPLEAASAPDPCAAMLCGRVGEPSSRKRRACANRANEASSNSESDASLVQESALARGGREGDDSSAWAPRWESSAACLHALSPDLPVASCEGGFSAFVESCLGEQPAMTGEFNAT